MSEGQKYVRKMNHSAPHLRLNIFYTFVIGFFLIYNCSTQYVFQENPAYGDAPTFPFFDGVPVLNLTLTHNHHPPSFQLKIHTLSHRKYF